MLFCSPQDISFFDAPENSSGALLSALASDAASVRGAVGDRLGHILTLLSCGVGSYAIAFKSRWEERGVGQSKGYEPVLHIHILEHSASGPWVVHTPLP